MSLADAIQAVVADEIEQALAPYLRRLSEPEPLVYSVREAAQVLSLSTSTRTVRRLVDEGILPIVPHLGQRILIPRAAAARLVEGETARDGQPACAETQPRLQAASGRWASSSTSDRTTILDNIDTKSTGGI